MFRDHEGAPRSVAAYLVLMWVPLLAVLILGPPAPTSVASVIAAVVLVAVVCRARPDTALRRVLVAVLSALRRAPTKYPPPPTAPLRRRAANILPRQRVLLLCSAEPRAPAVPA
ncbi:MAG: hypothetical protein WAV90_18585 [Gordonia amarae]